MSTLTELFTDFVSANPTVTSLNSTDLLYIQRGGASKSIAASNCAVFTNTLNAASINATAGTLSLKTNGTEHLRIDSGGDIIAVSGSIGYQVGTGNAAVFTLVQGPNGTTVLPVPTFYPTTNNTSIAFDICPHGVAVDIGYGKCWLDICNTDQIQFGNSPTQTVHISTHAASHFIGAALYSSGSILPFVFGTFQGDTKVETTSFTINTDATVTAVKEFSLNSTGVAQAFQTIDGLLSNQQLVANNASVWHSTSFQVGNNNLGAFHVFAKTRATTVSSFTALQSGDFFGCSQAYGADGSTYIPTGSFGLIVDGAVSGGSVPTAFFVRTGASAFGTEKFRVTSLGSTVLNSAAIATNATDGFLYIPTCAGAPIGTPTANTGRVPLVFDTSTSQFWIYTGGAWTQPKTPAGAATVTWQ